MTKKMKRIAINENGPTVSAGIYGFWRWTEKELSDLLALRDIVDFTRELGIDAYDLKAGNTALLEAQFGELLKNGWLKREEIVLTTKVGTRKYETPGRKGIYSDLRPATIQKTVEESLQRLNTDYIDILNLESIDYLHQFEHTASTLLKLQRAGKIKYVGVSNFNVFQQRLLSNALGQPIIANQLELNLLNTSALTDGRIDFIKEQHSRPIASAPLADGKILLGQDDRSVRLRQALTEIGRAYDANTEQTAVAWLLKLGALPLIGSLEKRRIQNAATASNIDLNHEDWYYLLQQAI